MTIKTCTVCKETRDSSDFHKDTRLRDGYRSQCKTCVKGQAKLDRKTKREESRESIREYFKGEKDEYRCNMFLDMMADLERKRTGK